VNLVAADERIAKYRHPIPTRKAARRTLLVALTGRRHGLHASLTRMVSFGRPDGELERRHAAVLRVDAHYLVRSRPGRSLGEIVDGAVSRYAEEGFPAEWKLHHQGGLTGYAGREIFGAPGVDHRLRANQAVAWNPSITSVKSEDTALVTADGVDVLTTSGAWPQVNVRVEGEAVQRPALLEAAP
jgi:antitoxin VapB